MYCTTCGKEITANLTECPICGANPTVGDMYCYNCGHFKIPGDTKCINCGIDFTSTQPPTINPTIPNNSSTIPPEYDITKNQNQQSQSYTQSTPGNDPSKKYCRNCGLIIEAYSLRCPYCDSPENTSTKYCPHCGMASTPQDTSCAYCGTKFISPQSRQPSTPPPPPNVNIGANSNTNFNSNTQYYNTNNRGTTYIPSPPPTKRTYSQPSNTIIQNSDRSFIVTLLLCLFLGYLGIHRIYTKNYLIGIIQFFTGGGCGIWWLIDLILLLAGSYKDGDGLHLSKNS